MATTYDLTITANDGVTPVTATPRTTAINLENTFRALSSGSKTVAYTVACRTAMAYASATVTCASVSAADTVTIAGVVLTAANGSPTTDQFDMSGTNTADGADLARAINANAKLAAAVVATAANGVVTITALQPGTMGNAITLTSSNGTRLACTGSGYLASGAETLTTHTY